MLALKIRGEFGRISDELLNSSPPTSIIPRITQIVGILNTVLGRRAVPYKFSNNKELLREIERKILVRRIYVVRIPEIISLSLQTVNWSEKGLTTNTTYQYVRNFEYVFEIEFVDNNLENELYDMLKNRIIKFTPVLGSSECLTDISISKIPEESDIILELTDHVGKNDRIVLLRGYTKDYVYKVVKWRTQSL